MLKKEAVLYAFTMFLLLSVGIWFQLTFRISYDDTMSTDWGKYSGMILFGLTTIVIINALMLIRVNSYRDLDTKVVEQNRFSRGLWVGIYEYFIKPCKDITSYLLSYIYAMLFFSLFGIAYTLYLRAGNAAWQVWKMYYDKTPSFMGAFWGTTLVFMVRLIYMPDKNRADDNEEVV
ncbi:hypothetical protein SDC9_72036 [bioreactor metagenome]|uniref:Uncharacterized protein n=1 Tax=bioreactor metagenome TaxID=1076179 RepID=A0A644YAM3_9ZZZZ